MDCSRYQVAIYLVESFLHVSYIWIYILTDPKYRWLFHLQQLSICTAYEFVEINKY